MKGQDKAMELLQEQLFRLRTVGVAFSVIGHVRQTTITDPITNESYQQITSDVSQRYFNQLKKNIDLVGIAYIDRELVKNKANGKEVVTVKSETRKIKFRDDNYTVDSGSRMSQIVGEIDFTADDFIKAMIDALEAEVKKGGKSVEDRKKENEKEEKANMKRIAEAEVKAKTEKNLDEVKNEIIEFFTANKTNMAKIKPVLEVLRENGFSNPNEINDISFAKKILDMASN
jgi:hypothetical protein